MLPQVFNFITITNLAGTESKSADQNLKSKKQNPLIDKNRREERKKKMSDTARCLPSSGWRSAGQPDGTTTLYE